MDVVAMFLSALILFGFAFQALLKGFEQRIARKFPWCKKCGKNMVGLPLGNYLPAEIQTFLEKFELPQIVVSKFFCPRCYRKLWYIPRFGQAEKGLFVAEEL